jgi:hypothetical protein
VNDFPLHFLDSLLVEWNVIVENSFENSWDQNPVLKSKKITHINTTKNFKFTDEVSCDCERPCVPIV